MARTQVAISTDDLGELCCISVWDVTTGNVLTTFKATNQHQSSTQRLAVSPHCIGLLSDHYLVCTYRNSPILNVWSLAKQDHLHQKMILPGVVNALAISNDGCYCLAAIDAKIYIWQISSGNLLNVLERHYQRITCLAITTDSSRFISGGNDGLVLLWDLCKCITHQDQTFTVTGGASSQYDPLRVINHSTSKVTDIYLNELANVAHGGHFVVGSDDHRVKLYSIINGGLLATILLPSPVRSVVMDRAELRLFAGLQNGDICETYLTKWNDFGSRTADNLVLDLTRVDQQQQQVDANTENQQKSTNDSNDQSLQSNIKGTFTGHTAAVTCCAVTIDGHGLLSGSADCTIKLWHISSRQCMRTVTCKAPITNILLSPSPTGLFVFDSFESQQNLELSQSSNFAMDISRNDNNSGSGSIHTMDRSLLGQYQSRKYSRLPTYDSVMKKASNPPPYVAPFKREIYRPTTSDTFNTIGIVPHHQHQTRSQAKNDEKSTSTTTTTTSSSTIIGNAFDRGVVWLQNDTTSGATFWPWSEWNTPSDEDLDRIFDVQNIPSDFMLSQLLGPLELPEQQQKKKKKNKKTKKNPDDDDDIDDDIEQNKNGDDDHEDEDDNITSWSNLTTTTTALGNNTNESSAKYIQELRKQNEALFKFSIEKIFSDL